jgi:NifU-like protein involved in Fe-S cluster formation
MAYSEKVIEHYENPRNVGAFNKEDDDVGTGLVGAPACGDVMRLQIKVQDLWLRIGHCFVLTRYRMDQGKDAR